MCFKASQLFLDNLKKVETGGIKGNGRDCGVVKGGNEFILQYLSKGISGNEIFYFPSMSLYFRLAKSYLETVLQYVVCKKYNF